MFEENRFENLLKSLRVRKGKVWTQSKTAELLGVSRRTYVGWENGESLPLPRDLKNITETFELNDTDRDMLFRAASQMAPEIHNLPFPDNSFFTGRRTYLELLANQLKENGTAVITGLGGIGKTELALKYAHSYYLKAYRTVLWMNAASKVTLEKSYLSVAHLLKLPEQDESKVDAVNAWLEGHIGWLLILDNADDLKRTDTFLPKRPRGHILLTTRSQIIDDIVDPIELEKMKSEEGLRFLLLRSGLLKHRTEPETLPPNVRDGATQLVEFLGGHPLALEQAGAYIQASKTSFASYMQIYHQRRLALLGPKPDELGAPGKKHSETVAVTFNICFQRVRDSCPLADDVLHLCAFLSPDNIPEELFSPESSLNLSITMFDKTIAALRRYSLIKRNTEEKLLSIHCLVQAILQDTIAEQDRKRWAKQAIQTVNAAMRDIETKPSSRPTTLRAWSHYRERYLPHLEACAKLIKLWEVESYEAAELLDEFAHHLSFSASRFSPDELIEALCNTISMWKKVRGPDDLHIVDCLKLLIMQYMWQNRYDKVRKLAKRILIIEQHTDPAILNTFPFRVTIMSGLTPPDQLGS